MTVLFRRPVSHCNLALLIALCPVLWGQSKDTTATDASTTTVVATPIDSGIHATGASSSQPTPTTPDKRIFGVLPNYRTAESSQVFSPISTSRKFSIATKDSFDGPGFGLAGVFALLYQGEDENPSFGQGVKGYTLRYVTAYTDQVVGNMMTEAIFPSLLHEDPRYFRRGTGPKARRAFYALSRVLVTRTDSGGTRFNFSEVLGNGVAAGIGNAYYADERGVPDTLTRMGTSIGTDAISDVLKEFWPDVKRHFHRHRSSGAS